MRLAGSAALATVAIAAAGCGGSTQTHASLPNYLPIARPAAPAGAPGAHVRILAPAANIATTTQFTARVAVAGFSLVGPGAGRSPVRGSGHLQFVLDGGRLDQPQFAGVNGRMAVRLGVNGFYSPAYLPQITYQHVPVGQHALVVRLVNRDETPTGVSARVQFVVR